MVRIMIVDDQHLEREGYRALLQHASDIEIVGEAYSAQQAMELIPQLSPDIVLMDVNLPDLDGLQATKHILNGHMTPRILIVTQYVDDFIVGQAIKKGASGFISKEEMTRELLPAIRAVNQGGAYYGASIASLLPEGHKREE